MKNKKLTESQQLTRIGIAFVGLLIFWNLYQVGAFNFLAAIFVNHAISTMKSEVDQQANQLRTIVFKSGDKLKVKRVLDQGQYWGFIKLDGSTAGAIKKIDVESIIDESASTSESQSVKNPGY